MSEHGNGGYVRVFRKLLENPVFTQLAPAVLKVMLAFLMKANWKPGAWYDGTRQVEIPRGSFITSYQKMAEICHLSVKQTRLAFGHLDRLEFATYRRACKWTMVTVLNYELYQGPGDEEGTVEGSLRAGSGQDEGRIGATIEEVKKGITTPKPPEGAGNGFPAVDLDDLPFGTLLDPLPSEVNGKYNSAGKNGSGRARKAPEALQRVAERIHARHPKPRRDIGVGCVEKKLAEILKHQHVSAADQESYLERIDCSHAAMCASEGWQKEGGQFAKGLENWLAPTRERYLAEPPSAAGHGEPPRIML